MKRKTIFIALFSAFVACSFVACSNDSDALDINVGTRSVGLSSYMTRDELQARLNEIGEKYGTRVLIDEDVDVDLVTEDVFIKLEEHLSSKQETKANRINTRAHVVNETSNDSLLMDDSSIDDIMLMAAPPSGETYSGSIMKTIHYRCHGGMDFEVPVVSNVLITWSLPTGDNSVSMTARIETGHGDYATAVARRQAGTITSPVFDYVLTIYDTSTYLSLKASTDKKTIHSTDNIFYNIVDGDTISLYFAPITYSRKHEFEFSYPE